MADVNADVSSAMEADGLDPSVLFSDDAPANTEAQTETETPVEQEAAPENVPSVEEQSEPIPGSPEHRATRQPSAENLAGERERLREENIRLKAQNELWESRLANLERNQQPTLTQPQTRTPTFQDFRQRAAQALKNEGYTDEQLRDPLVQRLINQEAAAQVHAYQQEALFTKLGETEEYTRARDNEERVNRAFMSTPELSQIAQADPDLAEELREAVFARWLARYDDGETAESAVNWLTNVINNAARKTYESNVAKLRAKKTTAAPIVRTTGGAPSVAKRTLKGPPGIKNTKDALAAIRRDFGAQVAADME